MPGVVAPSEADVTSPTSSATTGAEHVPEVVFCAKLLGHEQLRSAPAAEVAEK